MSSGLDGLLGLYWKAREQPLDDCADLCLRTLLAMRAASFDGFYHRGRSRKDALRRTVDVTFNGIRELLKRGVNRRDDNRQVIPELGYSMGSWSGRSDDESFGLMIHCGSYSEWVGNNVVITLPRVGPHSLDEAREEAETLFDDLVELWKPDQAILCIADDLRWDDGRIPTNVPAFKRYPWMTESRD